MGFEPPRAAAAKRSPSAAHVFRANQPWRAVELHWQDADDDSVKGYHIETFTTGQAVPTDRAELFRKEAARLKPGLQFAKDNGCPVTAFSVHRSGKYVGFGTFPHDLRWHDLPYFATRLAAQGLTLKLDLEWSAGFDFAERFPWPDSDVTVPPLARDVVVSWRNYATNWREHLALHAGETVPGLYAGLYNVSRQRYAQIIGDLAAVDARPRHFHLYAMDYTTEDARTIIYAANGDASFVEFGETDAVAFEPVAVGAFDDLSADELAFVACRLAAVGTWFVLVPDNVELLPAAAIRRITAAPFANATWR